MRRRARHRDEDQVEEDHRQADRQRRRDARAPLRDRDGVDHRQQHRAVDDLDQERAALADHPAVDRVRPEVGDVADLVANDCVEQRGAEDRANELEHDVDQSRPNLDVPRQHEGHGHDRVDVPAGDVVRGVDHHRDAQPVRDRDGDQPGHAPVRAAAGGDRDRNRRARREHHEQHRADQLREIRPQIRRRAHLIQSQLEAVHPKPLPFERCCVSYPPVSSGKDGSAAHSDIEAS